ncbi:MAG: HaeIII family restriction endonuclease [Rickettsia sp.]|uniref:HaeIII family restriction endonuclease n=1 Tax=Rickettsia sp. TaxID=789 RepID=UPI00397C9D3E
MSCKTNHQALKHPRLSDSIDFVKKWGLDGNGCSAKYWDIVKPLFGELRQIKTLSNKTALWENLLDKANKYYWPILNAWSEEITNLCSVDEEKANNVCKALISYLIGKYDFYKIMCYGSNKVFIQAYNFNNTLNTKKTNYPNYIHTINTKNGGIYSKTIVFNRGFSINFRIHNASSRVEPSLKFDINAIGLPTNEVYQHTFDIID